MQGSDPCELCDRKQDRSFFAGRCKCCRDLIRQAKNRGNRKRIAIDEKAAVAAIREAATERMKLFPEEPSGYVCAYSQILLGVGPDEWKYGDYASFDHASPGRGDRAVLCSRIVNDLKGWMTDKEFRVFMTQVSDVAAPRRIHGKDERESSIFLALLQQVMRASGSEPDAAAARGRLKSLSRAFFYAKTIEEAPKEPVVGKPGEAVDQVQ